MSVELQRFELIDDKTKMITFGFIRNCEKLLNSSIIPQIILKICALFYFDPEPIKIPLKFHSDRGHWSESYHPKGILNKCMYFSQLNPKFKPNENDWLIFEYDDINDDKLYVPQKFSIENDLNSYPHHSIKLMSILIGDVNKNKWYIFKPNKIQIQNKKNKTTVQIDGVDWKIIKKNKLTMIKLEFIENYGSTDDSNSKFCCTGFELFGYQC